MFRSAKDTKEKFGYGIDVVEYKASELENLARARKLGVRHLPGIYANGKPAHESIIPSR